MLKPVIFIGRSLADWKRFPKDVQTDGGYQLDLVQNGLEPNDYRPMPNVGAGVSEIRVQDEAGAFRMFYVAKFEAAVYVLHVFQKKTQQTDRRNIEMGQQRYREMMRMM